MALSIFSIIAFIIGVVVLPLIFTKMIYPDLVKRKPGFALIAAAFFVLIGFMAAFFVFFAAFSIAMVAFSSLMLLPFIIKLLETESRVPEERPKTYVARLKYIFQRNESMVKFYTFMFFGMALEYTILFAVLPPALGDIAFENQLALFGPVGHFSAPELFLQIVGNNIQILLIAFALSIFYGAGSIFILNYNASISGVLYGSSFRTLFYGTAPFAANIALFLPHTILEILAYLLAAVSGGILVRGLDKDNVYDALIIFTISLSMIFVAGWVEVVVPFL
jgi:uncharacterized membrane protein SpoIIM required for sporulation